MKTILVVDDEFGIAEALAALLSDEGFRVITAVNGRQALQKVAEARPDLIILDLMMPVLDGGAVLEALQASEEHKTIPVVLMSGVAENAVKKYAPAYAAFLRKPFTAGVLLREVKRLL